MTLGNPKVERNLTSSLTTVLAFSGPSHHSRLWEADSETYGSLQKHFCG